MICKRFLAIFLKPEVSEKTTIITVNNGEKFKTNGKVILDKGYTIIYDKKDSDNELPSVSKGQIVNVDKIESSEKTTTPETRLTQGSLIALMENVHKVIEDKELKEIMKENKGIGTPATRSTIIKSLLDDGYMEEKGSKKTASLYITEKGKAYIENLKGLDIISPELTAEWDTKLKQISEGTLDAKEVEKEMFEYTRNIVKQINSMEMRKASNKKIICKCPSCSGDIIVGEKSYYCSNWKKDGTGCFIGFSKKLLGATITEKDAEKLFNGKSIKKKVSKDDKSWEQEFELKDGKLEFVKKESKIIGKCPKCNKNLVECSSGWKCENYKNGCDVFFGKEFSGAKISEQNINSMLKDNKKIKKKMLSKKTSKEFEGYISINKETGKYDLSFDKK